VPSLLALFKDLNTQVDALEKKAAEVATWEDLVNPYEQITDAINVAYGIVSNLQAGLSVVPNCNPNPMQPCLTESVSEPSVRHSVKERHAPLHSCLSGSCDATQFSTLRLAQSLTHAACISKGPAAPHAVSSPDPSSRSSL
jgi:hypothetical protein